MPTASLPAGDIHYQRSGPASAPVLVLSNSLGTKLELWDPQLAAFEREFHVVRYDSRGHGRSWVPPGPYSIENLGRDVLALMDHLGLRRANFCGISVGGMTGMWLGRYAPERVNKLILCNTRPWNDATVWNNRIENVRKNGLRAIAPGIVERWFTPRFRQGSPSAVLAAQKMVEDTPEEGYVATCEAIRDMDLRGELSRIGASTLVISGTHDAAAPPEEGRFIAEQIPGAQYAEIDTSHISNIEGPEAFLAVVARFLRA
jgi:3-oxoadipate enol-lactonase